MPQYFDNNDALGHKEISVRFELFGENYLLKSDLGVFSKDSLDEGTRFLLETISQESLGQKILDLGCGIGTIGLVLAHLDSNKDITMCDVNLRALELAKANAVSMGVAGQVQIVESDVYTNINSTYDSIISNPPIRAGKKVTYRIYDEASRYLNEGGKLIIVIRKKQGAPSVYAHLQELFSNVSIAKKHKGYQVIIAKK
ncbi:MAG: methyltransferase [Bacilli bacterium]|nr:methyltransferase [Bacilli bacterium]